MAGPARPAARLAQRALQLALDHLQGAARLALGQRLARRTRWATSPAFSAARVFFATVSSVSPKSWRRSEWPRIDVRRSRVLQHRRRDLAGEGALVLPVHVLGRQPHRACPAAPRPTRERGEGRDDDDLQPPASRHALRDSRTSATAPRRPSCSSSSCRRSTATSAHGVVLAGRPTPGSGVAGSGTRARRRRPWTRGRSCPRAPSALTAATLSPPPTTVVPSPSAIARATASVPSANGFISNTPMGPFQSTIFAPRISLREQARASRARCRGPSSRPGPGPRAACGARRPP